MEARCRICTRTKPFESVPLDSRQENARETVSNMLTYCTQLEVSSDDSLPQQICHRCLRNLTIAFEFRRLCYQSDATFRKMLLQAESRAPTPAKTDPEDAASPTPVEFYGSPAPVEADEEDPTTIEDEQKDPTEHPKRTATVIYHCCFKRCDHKSSDYSKLQDHAKKNHQTRRHGNARRRREDHRFVCAICKGGFSGRLEWNMHRALLRGVQRCYECARCRRTFPDEEKLVLHMALEGCGEGDKEREDDAEPVLSTKKSLIRRILKAKATNGLVRIDEKEVALVMADNASFLEKLHRNEMRHSSQRARLFYVCEACSFRTEVRDEVVTHLDIGTCRKGFYMALGFRALKLRYVQCLECKSCGYRSHISNNFRRHQQKFVHSGIRKSKMTRQVAEREYPCEYCGRIFSTFNNRKRHQSTCTSKTEKIVSSASKELPSIEDVTLPVQLPPASEDDPVPTSTPKKDEDEPEVKPSESLQTEFKIEEYDPLEGLNDGLDHQQQESEHDMDVEKQVLDGQRVLVCKVCGYITNHRGNLNRHRNVCGRKRKRRSQLHKCTQCRRLFSTEGKLASHMILCKQNKEDQNEDEICETPPFQDLTQKIMEANAPNGLVRINECDQDIVLEKGEVFIRRLHCSKLKYSKKRVRLFYICEACYFRAEIRREVLIHIEMGTCTQGYYMAFGFRAVNTRSVQVFECEMCAFRTENTGNIRRHQMRRNHSGYRRIKATKEVAVREYPCEYCGRVFTSHSNRSRHRKVCSYAAGSIISNELEELLNVETVPRKEFEEKQVTELNTGECEPQETTNQSESDQQAQQESEPAMNKLKHIPRGKRPAPNDEKRKLKCTICDYATDKRGNLNRHMKTCSRRALAVQSSSSDSE